MRYSPDGSIVLAGGNSKFVCMYEVSERILLKKFQISHNQSLDGILDKLNSKEITEAGPKSSIDDDVEEKYVDLKTILEEKNSLPGANIGNLSSRKVLPAIRSKDLAFAPSGDTWAVASTEGLLLYSLSREALFDPFDLDMDITPETIKETFLNGEFSRALLMSLRLNEKNLIELIVEHIPPSELSLVVRSIPPQALKRVLDLLADLMENSSFLEFYLLWLQTILVVHGNHIKKNSQLFNSSLRAIQKRVSSQYASISHLCHRNQYQLEYLSSFARHKMEPLQENYPLKRVTRE